ncbi:hypothetical protein AWJ20_4238 [Sugiyamaella lignohabitans]|uniref:CAP-Gly domain-containing protein n=1 Tax=Sugiyamaella lignohabitans TaxID=796027 RepID=A0A161HJ94_9ASCO|nr:uncharacterized protein AWJ20_4238 [Sugiyamaella lignohabitans]ANB11428.1 hypothetical protein AWJ20_4238 [Sugiyamaella lignohabitans]
MSTPLTPRTPRPSGLTRTGLNIGDTVTLPEGQRAILRFVGKIQGKPGEYAGVELIGDYESQGRHSGTYNGVSYFTTSRPNTGLFITYSKLIGSSLRNSGPPNGAISGVAPPGSITRNRLSMGPGSVNRPQLHHPHSQGQQSAALQASPSAKSSSISKRTSLVPTLPTTPRRNTTANGNLMGNGTPGLGPAPQGPYFMSPPQGRRTTTTGSNTSLHQSSGSISRSNSVRTPDTASRSVNRVTRQQSAEDEARIAALSRELEEAKLTINEKDKFLEEQAVLLRDVEESLHEFQMLAKSQEEKQDSAAGPYDIDTLLKTIEERDRKINTLRTEFENNRQEFRLTIDSLQLDLQETAEVYETEIRTLKENAEQAEVIHGRIAELQFMVTSLEKGLKLSQKSEESARQQLSNLADIENKLLEKEQELKEASERVEHYRSLMKNAAETATDGDNSNSALALQQVEATLAEERQALAKERKLLQEEKKLTSSLQKELAEAKEAETRLNSELTTTKSELEDYKQKLQALTHEVTQHKSSLEGANKEIEALKTAHAEQAAAVPSKEDKLKYELAVEEVALLESKVKSLEQQVKQSQSDLDTSNMKLKEIDNLESKIKDLETQLDTAKKDQQQQSLSSSTETSLQEELTLTRSLYEEEQINRQKLQDEIEKLESIVETKIFKEAELEKQIELLKLSSAPTSRTVSGSRPTTPQLLPTSREDDYHHPQTTKSPLSSHDLPIYKSPSKVDPAAGRTLWCGLCEREGHESLDCPYEEEF